MTIDTPTGGKLEVPDTPELSFPATVAQHMAFAKWQEDVTRAIFAAGLRCQWIHDELSIWEYVDHDELAQTH